MLYSVLVRCKNGAWVYNPGMTYDSAEEAEEGFRAWYHYDLEKPHKIFEHATPLPQFTKCCTYDFNTFKWQGNILWRDNAMVGER